ncbi:MAG: hypothetical protein HOP28_08825 [Gemmatimonadales bacterium]|nr:hypothetical protein [Gemmatimonadales bacterium]
MAEEKKTRDEMVGEFLREAAVLVLVFGILDGFFASESDWKFLGEWKGAITVAQIVYGAVVIGVSLLLLKFGLDKELKREE